MTRRGLLTDLDGSLGNKLGPRLVQLVTQSVLATRAGLAPHEARVQAAGLQAVIDRMGEEHAAFVRPLTDALLAREELPEELRHSLGRAASGRHQWEARALTGLLSGTASSALGTVLSNYLFPVTGELVARAPSLPPDVVTLAGLASRRFISEGFGAKFAAMQGTDGPWFELLTELAYTYITPELAIELIRRGAADRGFLHNAMRFAGYHPLQTSSLDALIRTWLTPADAALGVLRGNVDHDHGVKIAEAAGIIPADFQILVDNTGEPLGLMQLLEAFRRGIISEARLERGIRQSRVRNEWIDTAKALRFEPMSTADAADAALRGHLSEQHARQISELNGLRPEDWPAYFANQGNPPAPEQLLELWRRGYIDQGRVREGLRQGRTRDNWISDVEQLRYEPISTADAVDAWLRGHIDERRARAIMAENGLIPRDHDIAFADAGNPLGLEALLEALRRGFIDQERFTRGFRESRYRTEWHDVALRLKSRPMSTADAIEAAVQGHQSIERARKLALENGLEAQDFEALYQTAGSPLSRTELEQLYNRGLIDKATVVQGLRESRLKLKYTGLAFDLHVREPEARAVVQMLEFGAIDAAEALGELLKLGYSRRVATAFVHEAEARATGGHRQLATAQVTSLYEQHLIGRPEAEQLLGQLHYTAGTAAMLLNLADHTRHQRILNTGITAVRNGYLHHHLDELEATADLSALKVPAEAITAYLTVWQLERRAVVRQLTEAQIAKAYKRDLFAADAAANRTIALERLRQLGYTAGDAELLLEEV